MDAELKKQFEDFAKGVKHIQDKVDGLEKKQDAVDSANVKETAEKAAQTYQDLQDLKTKIDSENLTDADEWIFHKLNRTISKTDKWLTI